MTARGLWVGTAGVLAVAAGLLQQWPELVAVGVGLLALLLVPLALRHPSSASWADVSAPVRVVRSDPAEVVVSVNVPEGSTRWVSAVDDLQTDRVFLPGGASSSSSSTSSSCELAWPVDTSRRGLFHVGPSRLEARDPFGLSVRVLASRTPSPVLVVPRVHPVDARLSLGAADAIEAEERAGSEVFHSIREYVVGDPQKLVHWRSTARTGKLMVRRMVDTTVPWLLVVLDVNARAYDRAGAIFEDFDSEAFERSVDTAASWAWHACGADQRVLLTTTSASSAAVSAEVTARTRESALDWLAVVDPLPAVSCGPRRVEAMVRRQGVGRALLVTGSRSETSSAWVAGWRRVAPVTVVTGAS